MSGTWICSECNNSNPLPDGHASRPQVILEWKSLSGPGSSLAGEPLALSCQWCGAINIV
jgi:hypothetical protein